MLRLRDIPLFSQLSPADLGIVEGVAKVVDFAPGSTLCRKGDPGRHLFVIASGGVRIQFDGPGGVFLGPGHIIGELSILSGMPVSASVTAAKKTQVYAFSKEAFLKLLDASAVLHRTLSELLVDRLLQSPEKQSAKGSVCTLLLVSPGEQGCYGLARQLFRRILGYNAETLYCEFRDDASPGAFSADASRAQLPPFDCPPEAWTGLAPADVAPGRAFMLDRNRVDPLAAMRGWRAAGVTGQHLVLVLPWRDAPLIKPALCANDAVIPFMCNDSAHCLEEISAVCTYGEADVREVRVRSNGAAGATGTCSNRWSQSLDLPANGVPDSGALSGALAGQLNALARWSVSRGIGIAMGAGAARGFAHLGVLKVLEDAGIPVDYLSGTSIGGIVALVYAHTGTAEEAIRVTREWLGGRKKVLDTMSYFRASFYPGKKIGRAAAAVFGDVRIEDLPRPVSAVAADLITGEKIVLDSGLARVAALGTSAIPGIFPPIALDGRVLIDGAPVSRVPVDLLDQHRCRLKIAVNVAPSPNCEGAESRETLSSVYAFFGFRNVWLRSWEVQAYWDGVKETSHADILLEPETRDFGLFEFDRFDELVELGMRTATGKLDSIEAAVSMALNPESL